MNNIIIMYTYQKVHIVCRGHTYVCTVYMSYILYCSHKQSIEMKVLYVCT